MNRSNKKFNKSLMYNIIIIFILLLSFDSFSAAPDIIGPNPNVRTNVGPGETTTVPETTKKNWGVHIDNAEYHDYVEYDDQGRLVDKYNIIIAEGQGGLGSGGGTYGKGSSGVNSSGNSNAGVSNKYNDYSGIANAQERGEQTRYYNSDPNNNINNASDIASKYRNNDYQNRLSESAAKAESLREKNYQYNAYQVTKGAQVKDVDTSFVETTTISEKLDIETNAPISDKIETLGPIKQPKVDLSEKPVPTIEVTQATTKSVPIFETSIQDTAIMDTVTNEPNIVSSETLVMESETVVAAETTINETAESVIETSQLETTVESMEEQTEPLKQGEDGEKNREDEEAAFYEEGGDNRQDGKGDGIGETNRGVKIFVIDRKGNIGIEPKNGINNIQPLITGIFVSLLLLIGVIYYYMPYIFVNKKRKKSNYII